MIRKVYLVDMIEVLDESMMREYIILAKGYLRGYTYHRYTAIGYRNFMNSVFDNRCTFALFEYELDVSENLSDHILIDALLVKHMATLNDINSTEFMGYELTAISSYSTNGVNWFSTDALIDYCVEAIIDTQYFLEFIFATHVILPKYMVDQQWLIDLQKVVIRAMFPIKEHIYDLDLQRYDSKYWIDSMVDFDGVAYWYITTLRFLYG